MQVIHFGWITGSICLPCFSGETTAGTPLQGLGSLLEAFVRKWGRVQPGRKELGDVSTPGRLVIQSVIETAGGMIETLGLESHEKVWLCRSKLPIWIKPVVYYSSDNHFERPFHIPTCLGTVRCKLAILYFLGFLKEFYSIFQQLWSCCMGYFLVTPWYTHKHLKVSEKTLGPGTTTTWFTALMSVPLAFGDRHWLRENEWGTDLGIMTKGFCSKPI